METYIPTHTNTFAICQPYSLKSYKNSYMNPASVQNVSMDKKSVAADCKRKLNGA